MKKTILTGFTAVALSCSVLGAAQADDVTQGNITVSAPWSRATVPTAKVGGGFFIIKNNGDVADRLLGIESDVSKKVEIHEMSMDNGVMKMRAVDGLDIPAKGDVTLKPGSFHVMFMELKAPFEQGKSFPALLKFEKAGDVKVSFDIKSMGAKTADDKDAVDNGSPQKEHDGTSHMGHMNKE